MQSNRTSFFKSKFSSIRGIQEGCQWQLVKEKKLLTPWKSRKIYSKQIWFSTTLRDANKENFSRTIWINSERLFIVEIYCIMCDTDTGLNVLYIGDVCVHVFHTVTTVFALNPFCMCVLFSCVSFFCELCTQFVHSHWIAFIALLDYRFVLGILACANASILLDHCMCSSYRTKKNLM